MARAGHTGLIVSGVNSVLSLALLYPFPFKEEKVCFHGSVALMQEAQVRVGAFHARELKAFTEWYEKGQPSQLLFLKGAFLSFSCR